MYLIPNILDLHNDLKHKTYRHGAYKHFVINDPKRRDIHKASVRDRLLHHAIYRILYPYFDTKFIHDSYSCRKNKGTHRALLRFEHMSRKVSQNYTKQCYVLKCDIKEFFANIDHSVLTAILERYIKDVDIRGLLESVTESFGIGCHSSESWNPGDRVKTLIPDQDRLDSRLRGNDNRDFGSYKKGLPLGNLTSQLLVNIYMNEFDQFVKHQLKAKYYVRYADDFVLFSHNREVLQKQLQQIDHFLNTKLKLTLHPNKVSIKTIYSGVDFLGWVHFPYHRVLRTKTKHRILRRVIETKQKEETVISYLGMLRWGNGWRLRKKLRQIMLQ